MERHKAVPASYLILDNNQQVYLIRRFNTGYMDGYYSVPSGHIEAGESPIDCVIREGFEEVGVLLNREDVKFSSVFYRAKADVTGERVDFFFSAQKWENEPSNMEEDKCDDGQWFQIDSLPEKIIPFVKDAILGHYKKETYREVGF